jgi:multiple sugar transport system permease protein
MDLLPGKMAVVIRFAARKPYWTVVIPIALLAVVAVYPIIELVRLSLHNAPSATGGVEVFVGLKQFGWILESSEFRNSLKVTFIFIFGASVVEIFIGFALALLFNVESTLARVFRLLLVLPAMLAPVAVGLIWVLILNSDFGILNYLLGLIGIEGQAWLASPALAMRSLILIDAWQWAPFVALFLLAGLRSLPTEPFEAAKVDGASPIQIFRYLTLPMLQPVLAVVFLIRVLDGTKLFGLVLVLTSGGPGSSTNVLGLEIFKKAFEGNQMNFAAGMAVIQLLLVLLFAGVYTILFLRSHAAAIGDDT